MLASDSVKNESPLLRRILAQVRKWPSTHLGVGVVSEAVVDAAIELANRYDVDLMLVASRRQVDMGSLGAGYVAGWTASGLADYVRRRDGKGRILLCRDHGGPWQNPLELAGGYDERAAMASAKESYEEDIDAGFAVIHIDPSVGPDGKEPPQDVILARLGELYAHCWTYARKSGRDIVFEVGAEDQDAVSHSLGSFFDILTRILTCCAREGLPKPVFAVAQTGTKVMETRNVGLLDSSYRIDGAVPTEVFIPRLVAGLNKKGVMLKQHNTDYLSDEVLRWHPWLGIHAANVAPEFGVVESRAWARLLMGYRLDSLFEAFVEAAYNSRKWEKWLAPESQASDVDKAIIAGHYIFSTAIFAEIREEAKTLLKNVVDVDDYVRSYLKEALLRYMLAFRLVNP